MPQTFTEKLAPGKTIGDYAQTPKGQASLAGVINRAIQRGYREATLTQQYGRTRKAVSENRALSSADVENPEQPLNLYENALQEPISTVYEGLYAIRTNADFPRHIDLNIGGPAGLVFSRIGPNQEIQFGTIGTASKSVPIYTYATGYEISQEIYDYNETWILQDFGEALGRADVLLRNEIHLSAITAGDFSGARTIAHDTTGANQEEQDINTLEAALRELKRGSYLLCGTDLMFRLDKVLNATYADNSTPIALRRFLSAGRIIMYDGGEVTVGFGDSAKTYEYSGIDPNVAYLIAPQQNFRSYVKYGMRIQDGPGDLTRLIARQTVASQALGVYADVSGNYGAVKVLFG